MHPRFFLAAFLALAVSGCDQLLGQSQPHWALVNKPKIQSAISNTIKQRNPYPAELDNDYKSQLREYERTNPQISELKRGGMQRCMSLHTREPNKSERLAPPAPTSMYGIPMGTDRPSAEVKTCIEGIEKDQLILDLKAKAHVFNELQQRRREHDVQVQRIMDKTIDSAIEDYARANGFNLIVTNESSIAYNHSLQVLDITNGVIKQIQNPPPAQ